MEEKELIAKLRELRQIKPSQDWAVLTKNTILGQEKSRGNTAAAVLSVFRLFFAKPAYAGLVVIFVLAGFLGTFVFAQKSLPGDPLYLIKRVNEKAQAVFVSEDEKPQVSLELANKRLEELTKVVQTNQVRNLAPAINEFQESLSEAAKDLSKITTSTSSPTEIKRFVDQAKNIEEKTQEVKSLGVVIGGEELEELRGASKRLELELLVSVLKNMISDLENRTLTEEQAEILSQMKELVEEEKYSEALELYLINQ